MYQLGRKLRRKLQAHPFLHLRILRLCKDNGSTRSKSPLLSADLHVLTPAPAILRPGQKSLDLVGQSM